MRTLNRPMFRTGGSTGTGITSGLAPRQGYSTGLSAEQIKEIRDQARELSYRPRRDNSMNQFLIDFGLNLVSGTPKSNIFATAAEAAKDPMATMQKSRSDREALQYATEADMFKTLIGAQADIMGSEGQSKIFSKEQAAKAVATLMGEWQELRDKQDTMDPKDFADQKAIIFGQIQQYQKENPALASLFEDKDFVRSIKSKIKTKLKQSQKKIKVPNPNPEVGGTIEMTEAEYYANPENSNALFQEMGRLYMEYYNDMMTLGAGAMAEGGRAGYRNAGPVYGSPTMMSKAATDTEVEDAYGVSVEDAEIPAEMTNITEEELRRRLPPEVGDDVVKLLANSAEALEDFAMIKTAQDIARFNRKYGVDLTLPAEA